MGGRPVKKEFVVERDGRSFVLYAGLLDLAHERGLRGITTTLVQIPNELNGQMAICHATVETEQGTFTGLGDACPSNVTRMMVPHLIRMAETRAKARAMRDAVNVGVTALEELGEEVAPSPAAQPRRSAATRPHEVVDEPSSEGVRAVARAGSQPGHQIRRELHPLDGPEEMEEEAPVPAAQAPEYANGRAEPLPLGFGTVAAGRGPDALGGSASGERGPSGVGSPATPKQLQTIARMARAAGKTIETEGLTRAQASEIISSLIAEMGQLRAS